VSPTAGVICLAKPGDKVEAGQPLLELHSDDADRFDPALAALEGALSISENAPTVRPLIVDRITKEG